MANTVSLLTKHALRDALTQVGPTQRLRVEQDLTEYILEVIRANPELVGQVAEAARRVARSR